MILIDEMFAIAIVVVFVSVLTVSDIIDRRNKKKENELKDREEWYV